MDDPEFIYVIMHENRLSRQRSYSFVLMSVFLIKFIKVYVKRMIEQE